MIRYKDIRADDVQWSPEMRVVFAHLFHKVDVYIAERRLFEAHGCKKAIWICANVLAAIAAKEAGPKQTIFQELL